MNVHKKALEFRKKIAELPREDILEIIRAQDPDLIKQVTRIEWVFRNKLRHLNNPDGTPITERPLTNDELALLVDEPFEFSEELAELGVSLQQQQQLHMAKDVVTWAKHFLKAEPRVYQIIMLRHPSRFKVLRAGRRLGKTWSMAVLLLWYSFTTTNGKALVLAPMLAQAKLIYEEMLALIDGSEVVSSSVTRRVASPPAEINFSNGSTVRFFTSGMKSNGRSDATRGQEAHLLVLDELDYMGDDDLEAVLAMMQKTDKNQPDKMLVGASTPTGKRGKFYEWCTDPKGTGRFKEFWYPSYCFGPNTNITMANGSFKKITDIAVGDLVLTESGPQKVLNTFVRHVNDINHIKWYGNSDGLLVTDEHPFSAAQCKRRQKDFDWEWIEAKDLSPRSRRDLNSGFWLRSPIPTDITNEKIDLLALNKHLDTNNNLERVGVKSLFKTGRKFANDAPRYVELNESLAVILGWYMAEGSLDRFNPNYGCYQVVEWTLNQDEIWGADELQNALDKLGLGTLQVNVRPVHGTITYRLSNTPLAILLDYLCGHGSKSKVLSKEIMNAPLDFQDKLIKTYATGDGWERSPGNYILRTSSETLAYQIQMIGNRLGYFPSISSADQKPLNIRGTTYKCSRSWAVEYSTSIRSNLGKNNVDSETVGYLLRSKANKDFDGLVYNFEVENTNSYIANGLLVHNCHPHFDGEMESFLRDEHKTEMGFRHEVEADWGELAEGVYGRSLVDHAFHTMGTWEYIPYPSSPKSTYVMGVDWDKYGAGTSIVVLEICGKDHPIEAMRGLVRCAYREETEREEYSLLKAVDRIIELDSEFNFAWIYIDRGYGDVQLELLHKHGTEYPGSRMQKKVKGIQFGQSIEVRDPYSMQMERKEIKPFMVSTLREMLEERKIYFPKSDTMLYDQLSHYVVTRRTQTGRAVYEMASDDIPDHAHDALILAGLAITENYNALFKTNYATAARAVSNETFLNTFPMPQAQNAAAKEKEIAEKQYGNINAAPLQVKKPMTSARNTGRRPIRRKMF